MEGLAIPTTSALCLMGSDDRVVRNGMEPCATVLRLSRCHIRFGHFEYLYYSRKHEELKQLADYSIERFYPNIKDSEQPYIEFFKAVLKRSASLVAKWQVYGFVHGVLNTDNMSILGETFDYGPYTFQDNFDPKYVSNKNDHQGRYAYANQPGIVQWNLSALAEALLPLIDLETLKALLEEFWPIYETEKLHVYRNRLGLIEDKNEDFALIEGLESIFLSCRVDVTRFFHRLTWAKSQEEACQQLSEIVSDEGMLKEWLSAYYARLESDKATYDEQRKRMKAANPKYILRNYMLEEAIKEAHVGNFALVNDLLAIARDPFAAHPDFERYAQEPPSWACAINLTCSS
jgi:uncharacterized protein YdiU (UPF0061 family)